MNTPVERKTKGPKSGITSFTYHAVQRAMDAEAAKWGAPAGYYKVAHRAGIINRFAQVWDVKVRLFGGRIAHHELIVFAKDSLGEKPVFRAPYETFLKRGGKAAKLYQLDNRYPTSSLTAAIEREGLAGE